MPSRNSFSIRKLFSSPRRLSAVDDEPTTEPTVAAAERRIKRQSNSSEASNTSSTSTSTVFHPDSSITTPQAERGLTDNVVHELSQEEIDRIKAVVAAAAAAAATSLRLRMQEGLEFGVDGNSKPDGRLRTNTKNKKNRRVPQPIVVPPRTVRVAGTCTNEVTAAAAETERKSDRRHPSPGPSSCPSDQQIQRSQCRDAQNQHQRNRHGSEKGLEGQTGDNEGKSAAQNIPATSLSKTHAQPLLLVEAGNSQTDEDEDEDEGEDEDQDEAEGANRRKETQRLAEQKDGQKEEQERKKETQNQKQKETMDMPFLHSLTFNLNSFDSSLSASLYSPPVSSLSASQPIVSSPFSKSPRPPPRVSSYSATRASRKTPSEPKTAKERKERKERKEGRERTPKPKTTDPQSLIHPLYRGQNRELDGKKDSGIALDRSQTSDDRSSIFNKETDYSASEYSDCDSGSGSDSDLDLLQALAIQPEEAELLRQDSCVKSTTTTLFNMDTPSLSVPADDSRSRVNKSIRNSSITPILRQPSVDDATTPTFTRPRRAPSPAFVFAPSSFPSFPSSPPKSRPSDISHTSPPRPASPAVPTPPTLTSSPAKKQTRFLPALRLHKNSAAPVARKRSKKASRKRSAAVAAAALSVGKPGSLLSSGPPLPIGSYINTGKDSGSRWTLPDNVTELFNGRLFSRMEVNETLSFEKLQAIRESRALSQKLRQEREERERQQQAMREQEEREEKEEKEESEKAARLQQEKQSLQQQQDLVDAEQALLREFERETEPTGSLEPLMECVEESENEEIENENGEIENDEIKVSPLEPDESAGPRITTADTAAVSSVSPASPVSPKLSSQRSSYERPPARHPPPIPLPPPPHIASQLAWPEGDEDRADDGSSHGAVKDQLVKKTLLLAVTNEPDGSITPIEPFHMEDLPSRIGAAGVRVSILLPVEEEEAYFASSVAEQKERRRREREEKEKEEKEKEKKEDEQQGQDGKLPDEPGPSPVLPSKNPLRYSLLREAKLPLSPQTIPQVTVTDVDSQSQPVVVATPRPPRSARSTRSTRSTQSKPHRSAPFRSKFPHGARPLRSPSSSGLIPSSSIAISPQRDNAAYVYLPATAFSLVMPTYRHGPVRISRPESDAPLSPFSPLDGKAVSSTSPLSLRRKHMPALDDTLDWTAFQMAILGGAGDFFQDSVDYGHMSEADADEADSLCHWYLSMGFGHERLLTSDDDDQPAPAAAAHHHPQWPSISSVQSTVSSHNGFNHDGMDDGYHGHSRTTTATSICGTSTTSLPCGSLSTLSTLAATAVAEMPASRTPSPSLFGRKPAPYSRDTVDTTPRTLAAELQASAARAGAADRSSFASLDSYESMPQSPMADLVMTRGADGKEYVTPMGYNLSHDLGDFLMWETQNVYAIEEEG